MGRFEAVVRGLALSPCIDDPRHDYQPGAGGVAFDMLVAADSDHDAVATARLALADALAEAGVGAPHPPPGISSVPVALVLQDQPHVQAAVSE